MSAKKSPVLILMLIFVLAAAVVVAGCGGSGGTTTEEAATSEEAAPPTEEEAGSEEPAEEEAGGEEATGEEAGGEEEAETQKEERSGANSLTAEGKTVFTTNCGSCHTLQAAGTTGEVGPNLDELEPDLATVEHQVINGGGPMPAFGKEGILNAKEVKAVATYVSSVAGKG